jgi:hypothetical protein
LVGVEAVAKTKWRRKRRGERKGKGRDWKVQQIGKIICGRKKGR